MGAGGAKKFGTRQLKFLTTALCDMSRDLYYWELLYLKCFEKPYAVKASVAATAGLEYVQNIWDIDPRIRFFAKDYLKGIREKTHISRNPLEQTYITYNG